MKFIETDNAPIKAWTDGVPVEDKAMQQLCALASLPFIYGHVAVMPDVHWGLGATIGSVIATKGAVIPAAVGVDIGCGMSAQRTTLTASDLPDDLRGLRSAIEAAIPHGRTDNGGANDRGAWSQPTAAAEAGMANLIPRLEGITSKHKAITKAADRAVFHAGTLGGGNHFVEVCLDENQHVWIMLHSGSRGVGNKIGTYFIEKARKEMERYFINLPDKDLAYLVDGSELFGDYVQAVSWAQDYAMFNRALMMDAALQALGQAVPKPFTCDCKAVNCHHNYVSRERHFGSDVLLTRKGAVSAKAGELGIIPGSMGAKSFIVEGKGNRESFCSCSHGAGRKMGRNEARKQFTIEDHVSATVGVECRKDADVIDETPAAYKDIDDVMAAQAELVSVRHTLKQVVCVKG
jgi:tRNA-splicing ligase RtcB